MSDFGPETNCADETSTVPTFALKLSHPVVTGCPSSKSLQKSGFGESDAQKPASMTSAPASVLVSGAASLEASPAASPETSPETSIDASPLVSPSSDGNKHAGAA